MHLAAHAGSSGNKEESQLWLMRADKLYSCSQQHDYTVLSNFDRGCDTTVLGQKLLPPISHSYKPFRLDSPIDNWDGGGMSGCLPQSAEAKRLCTHKPCSFRYLIISVFVVRKYVFSPQVVNINKQCA